MIEKIKEFYSFIQNIYISVPEDKLLEFWEQQKDIILEKIKEIEDLKNNN